MTMRTTPAALAAAMLAAAGFGCQHEPAAKVPIPVSAAVSKPQSSGGSASGAASAAGTTPAKAVPSRSDTQPKNQPVDEPRAAEQQHPVLMACPWAQPGVTIDSHDVAGGAAITFTGAPERVAALRAFVGRMAEMPGWQAGHGMGPMPMRRHMGGGQMGGGQMGSSQMGRGMQQRPQIPPSRARAEEIPNGIRLIVVADDPDDTDRVRTAMHERAERMRAGACPLVPAQPQQRGQAAPH